MASKGTVVSSVNPTGAGTAKSTPARAKKARANTIRLMHLLYLLQASLQPLTRAQLLGLIEGYPDDPSSAARMFERDKATLRHHYGVELEIITVGDEDGYRIRSSSHLMPEVEFSDEERTMIALAGRAWAEQGLARASQQALATLAASGVELDEAALDGVKPRLSAGVPGFETFWRAHQNRQALAFDYRAGDGTVSRREVEPWLLGERAGAWYLVGFDRGRAGQRSFKLARVLGMPEVLGDPGTCRAPEGFDAQAALASLAPAPGQEQVVVAIRGEYAPSLRRRGVRVEHPVTPPGYAAHRLTAVRTDALVGELARYGPDALVLEPVELRERVIAHLRRVVAAHGRPATADTGTRS